MKIKSSFIATTAFLILFVFSPNIYYEITNYSKIENWYVTILNKDFSGMKAEEAFYELRNIGYKVDKYVKKQNGSQEISISPPYDQGVIAFFYNRFLFNYIFKINSKGYVEIYGLNK
ncbi:hypothetical protein A3194_14150 [Candidatus Thiodiazotropha endoloripes]|nr:hypothetical protein A3194_14150 [Candidatus Thiodiazotropha endoloripes]